MEISLLAPLLATIIATLNFIFVYVNFISKPWRFKAWIIVSMFFWIPWAGFTVLMRISETNQEALIYLQFSFVSSYICFYSLYRFHRLLSYRPTDNRLIAFGLAVFMGLNISLGLNPVFLDVIRTNSTNYWTDQFSTSLYILHVIFSILIGLRTYMALKKLDAFAIFYSSKRSNNPFQILFAAIIVASVGVLLISFFIQSNQQDATPFLILSIFITSFLGIIYGINPISRILAPQRLWNFIIIGQSGLPLFQYNFSSSETKHELALVAGALSASSVTISDYLNADAPLSMVELEERVILLETLGNLTYALIADHHSEQLQVVLHDTVMRITNHKEFKEYLPGKGTGKYNFTREILSDVFTSRRSL